MSFNMKILLKISAIVFLLASVCINAEAAKRKKHPVDTVGLRCRGVMETFRDVNTGIDKRLDLYRSEGMTHYFYCPSDDRYCNRWGWKFLYNDSDRHSIRNLNQLCSSKGLQFVWTLNPGERYGWNASDYKFLLDKLILMYYNGLRSFALDFTDHPGDHQAVRDSLHKDFVLTMKEPVELFVVDMIPEVEYPSEGYSAVESLMRGFHFDSEFISQTKDADAVLCNITSSDQFSTLALMSVADFAAAPDVYSPDQSIADAIEVLDGEVRDAFVTFLRHTGQVDESSAIEIFSLDEWSREKSDSLYLEFDKIEKVPSLISRHGDSAVIESMMPWLTEFGKLGTRGKKVLKCMEYYVKGNLRDFWITYLDTVMSQDQIDSYNAHPVGADKLHPFCMQSLQQMKEGFSSMLTGHTSLHNLASTLLAEPNASLDSDFSTYVSSSGHIEFAIPAQANTCHLLIGPLPQGERVIFRQITTDGSLVAEFIVRAPFTTFDIKNGAVKVDVLGDVEIYETIFVDLHP